MCLRSLNFIAKAIATSLKLQKQLHQLRRQQDQQQQYRTNHPLDHLIDIKTRI